MIVGSLDLLLTNVWLNTVPRRIDLFANHWLSSLLPHILLRRKSILVDFVGISRDMLMSCRVGLHMLIL